MENVIHKKPYLVYRDDKQVAVIMDINDYNEILERLDDEEDIEYLRTVREKPPQYRSFNEYLSEHSKNV